MPDRRESVWSDPRLWVSVCSILLTLVLALVTFLVAKLSAFDTSLQSTRDLVLIVQTRQDAERAASTAKDQALEARLARVESMLATQQQAYNFNFSTRLAGVEAKLGIKHPDKE